jgi:hypothetical protein
VGCIVALDLVVCNSLGPREMVSRVLVDIRKLKRIKTPC